MSIISKLIWSIDSCRIKYRFDTVGGVYSFPHLVKHLKLLARKMAVVDNHRKIETKNTKFALKNVVFMLNRAVKTDEVVALAKGIIPQLEIELASSRDILSGVYAKSVDSNIIIEEIAFQVIRHTHHSLDGSKLKELLGLVAEMFSLSNAEQVCLRACLEIYKINFFTACAFNYLTNSGAIYRQGIINVCKVDVTQFCNVKESESCVLNDNNSICAISKYSSLLIFNNNVVGRVSNCFNDNGLRFSLYQGNLLIADSFNEMNCSSIGAISNLTSGTISVSCKTTLVNDCEIRQYTVRNSGKRSISLNAKFNLNIDRNTSLISRKYNCVSNGKIFFGVKLNGEIKAENCITRDSLNTSTTFELKQQSSINFSVILIAGNSINEYILKYNIASTSYYLRDNFVNYSYANLSSSNSIIITYLARCSNISILPKRLRLSTKANKDIDKQVLCSGKTIDFLFNNYGGVTLLNNGVISSTTDREQSWIFCDNKAYCLNSGVIRTTNGINSILLVTEKFKVIATLVNKEKMIINYKFINLSEKKLNLLLYVRYNFLRSWNRQGNTICNDSSCIEINGMSFYLSTRHSGVVQTTFPQSLVGNCLLIYENIELPSHCVKSCGYSVQGNKRKVEEVVRFTSQEWLDKFMETNLDCINSLNNQLIYPEAVLLYVLSFTTDFAKQFVIRQLSKENYNSVEVCSDNLISTMKLNKFALTLAILNFINVSGQIELLDYTLNGITLRQYITRNLVQDSEDNYSLVLKAKCLKLAINILDDRFVYISQSEKIIQLITSKGASVRQFAEALGVHYFKEFSVLEMEKYIENTFTYSLRHLYTLTRRYGLSIRCGVIEFRPVTDEPLYPITIISNGNRLNVNFNCKVSEEKNDVINYLATVNVATLEANRTIYI